MPLFTPENARSLALRSWEARRQREAEEALKALNPPQKPEADQYLARRLARVRKQINRVDELIETEEDAQKLDRLVSAVYRLTELERVIANRPLPGSLRPSSKPDKRLSSTQASFDPPSHVDNTLSIPPVPGPYLGPENG